MATPSRPEGGAAPRSDEVLRRLSRSTTDPVLAEMADEVLSGRISLRDALNIRAYGEAFTQRVKRLDRELEKRMESQHPTDPTPEPDRTRGQDDGITGLPLPDERRGRRR